MNTLAEIEKHCAALAEQVASLRQVLASAKAERDAFVVHVWQSRKNLRHAIDNDGKSGKRQELALRMSFLQAGTLGFKGSFRQWEDVLTAGLFRE